MNRTLALLSLLCLATLLLSGCARNGDRGSPAAALSDQQTQAAAEAVRAATDEETLRKAKIERNRALRQACGKIRDRPEQWRQELATELAKLPAEYVRIIEAIDDGALARDAQRICRGEL